MFSVTYYAQDYAGIIGWSLVGMYVGTCLAIIVYRSHVHSPNLDLSINYLE